MAYLAGLRRAPAWPWRRTLWFLLGGAGSLLLLTGSWVGIYVHRLFWVYTLQVTMLLVITPMLLALGRPLTLMRQAVPVSRRFLDSTWFRVLANPLIGPLLVPITLGLIFFTPILPATAQSNGLLQALQVILLFLGFLFALPLAGENEHLGSFSLAVAMFVGSIELLADAVPGIVVRLRTHLLAPGIFDSLGDQQHGGAILWFLAEVIDVPFLGFLFVRWIRADRAEAARIDAELDA
ncbi:MAG: cytochrome c oxidase assembly protein, partial [Mycobacteriales bacterium]